jgi:hypothetical protein
MDQIHITVQARIDILLFRSGEAANQGLKIEFCNGRNRFPLSCGRCREAGFYCVDADSRELAGDLKLLLEFKGDPRGLFSIPKGGVENSDLFPAAAFNKEDNRPLP